MTVPPAGGHLDLDALAEVEEGLVSADRAAAAQSHLDDCGECRERLSRLRTTRALLSALPPETMPAPVAARVDAALGEAAATPADTTVVPISRRGRWWNTPALAGAAAGVAILVLVGAVIVGNLAHHGRRTSSGGSAASAGTSNTPSTPAEVKEWATGTDYSAATLAAKVPRLVVGVPPARAVAPSDRLSAGSSPGAASAFRPSSPGPLSGGVQSFTQDQLRASRDAVVQCGRILAGGVPTVPVAVDFARFDGKPAVIVALPAIGHASSLDVWVVRSTCSAGSMDLYFQRIPRPRTSG